MHLFCGGDILCQELLTTIIEKGLCVNAVYMIQSITTISFLSESFRFYLVLGHGESDSWSSTYQSPVSGKNHVWKHTTMDYCMLWAAAITTSSGLVLSILWQNVCQKECACYIFAVVQIIICTAVIGWEIICIHSWSICIKFTVNVSMQAVFTVW